MTISFAGTTGAGRTAVKRSRRERGVTLIELLIAITLVAALSVGMLMAMRTSLVTLERIDARLQSNRRVKGAEQILASQLGGIIPVTGACAPTVFFVGNQETLRMVSTYSIAGGARGSPQVLEFQVLPAEGGGVRLIVNEQLYSGPGSIAPLCADGGFRPVEAGANSFVLADQLAYCRISYHEGVPEILGGGNWVPVWNRPELPVAVRVEMERLMPDPGRLPLVSITVPIHVTRDFSFDYTDDDRRF